MLIQCHSCNTKYRLNLEQIPRRKTFVRCKNCGTPIYIDPTEDELPGSGIIPPQAAGSPPMVDPQDDLALVVCPGCDARYRIAAEAMQRPGVRLKCTQCGHQFAPPQAPETPLAVPPQTPRPPAAATSAPASVGREMPLPDAEQMDVLFDDLRPGEAVNSGAGAFNRPDPELGSLSDAGFEIEPPVPNAEQAYLDAVAFDEDGDTPARPGSVPDDQKFRLFLNPKEFQGSELGMVDQSEDKGAAPPEFGTGDVPDLPELDEPVLPPLPVVPEATNRDEMSQVREVVPGQAARTFTEKRVLVIVAAAAVLILAATGAWGYWLASTAGSARAFTVERGQPHQLALDQNLSGHYVSNGPSGKRLFVVNGEVENRFPAGASVRWIRIKGTAFVSPDKPQPIGTAFAYAGNVLEDSQLNQWEMPAIKAYYGFTNGRKDLNIAIPAGARVPFQLVFSDAKGDVGRTVAQIVSYHRDGQAVFIDTP